MKRKYLLFLILLLTGLTAFPKVWTVGNQGFTFNPATLTIKAGDSVDFVLDGVHNAVEVSQSTWNANGTTSLAGGFSTSLGGGMVLPAKLTVGIHYYVCTPHASLGMKGRITVETTTGISENSLSPDISLYPNPSAGKFRLTINGWINNEKNSVQIFNLAGKSVYNAEIFSPQSEIDLSRQAKGIYMLKLETGDAVQVRKLIIQ